MSEEVEELIRYRRRAISVLQDAIDTVGKGRDPMGLIGDIVQSLSEVHKGMALVSLEEHLKRV